MSLYGISNLEEISKKNIYRNYPANGQKLEKNIWVQKARKVIPEYAKTGLDMANFFGVTQNGDKINYEEFFSTEDKVLCFDDLEKSKC